MKILEILCHQYTVCSRYFLGIFIFRLIGMRISSLLVGQHIFFEKQLDRQTKTFLVQQRTLSVTGD